ncbi:MAG TPA: cupredoxin domain-containing protein [Gammaproteobacteria bacterium]|nr:cupredoxin domain-containing protein [Gammaproteobacteria bacterium]
MTLAPRLPLFLASALLAVSAFGAGPDAPVTLDIKDRGFVPQELPLPAGVKVELVIRNQDALPAEFESYDLSREIVVPAHGQVKVYIGPLDPGRYRFFNDFYQSAEGWVVVAATAK